MKTTHITCDLTIIGAGFAGMVAAARASCLGLETVQAGNSSELYFASGCFDLLGAYPSGTVLNDPLEGLVRLQQDRPCHPYAKNSTTVVTQSLDFVTGFLQSAGLAYTRSDGTNRSVLTAAGTFKPSFLVPGTMDNGQGLHKASTRLLIVEFKGLKGFSAAQIAAGLGKDLPPALTLSVAADKKDKDVNPVHLAERFEDLFFLKDLARQISPFSGRVDLVGMPAVCGINTPDRIMARLETLTRLKFFEIPMMPPSIPGLRLKIAFEKKLAEKKIHFLNQVKICSQKFNGSEFLLTAAHQNIHIQSKAVILATGRFLGGGLHAHRDGIKEPLFDLPVYQPPQRSKWHHLDFFAKQGHPINTAGIETDRVFRPVNKDGAPVYENLYAVGNILAHNDWARLKSGSGVSALSAVTAVNDVHQKTRAGL